MPRIVQPSGAKKRQAVKQKHEKDDAVIAKTRRLTDFFEQSCSTQSDHSAPDPAIDEEDVTSLSAEMVKLPSASNIDSNVAETSVDEAPTRSNDPALLFPVRECDITYRCKEGPEKCQNKVDSENYTGSKRYYNPTQDTPKGHYRKFKNHMFYAARQNGECHLRKWLLYSPSKGAVYCFYCTLMSNQRLKRDLFSLHDGFNNWKRAEERMHQHEDSEGHGDCIILFHLRSTESAHVDHDLEKQCQKQKKYWVEVVRRVVAVVTFLAERGLSFRGDDELIGSRHNGNFLGAIELIA